MNKLRFTFVLIFLLFAACKDDTSPELSKVRESTPKNENTLEIYGFSTNCTEQLFYTEPWNDSLITIDIQTNFPVGTSLIIEKGVRFASAVRHQNANLKQVDTLLISQSTFQLHYPPAYAYGGYISFQIGDTVQINYTVDCLYTKNKEGVSSVKFPLQIIFDRSE